VTFIHFHSFGHLADISWRFRQADGEEAGHQAAVKAKQGLQGVTDCVDVFCEPSPDFFLQAYGKETRPAAAPFKRKNAQHGDECLGALERMAILQTYFCFVRVADEHLCRNDSRRLIDTSS
jgi:hypothetical protein